MAAKSRNTSDADNVKVRVLHVMNMNHTEKKAKHMQQKDEQAKADHGRFPFRISKIKKNTLRRYEQRSFEKLDGI